MQRSRHPFASSEPATAANSSRIYGGYSGPTLHTSIMPPIGALPPKQPQQAAPAAKAAKAPQTSKPPKMSLLAAVLAILEGKQQLSIPIEVQVIFSFPVYLPFFSIVGLLCIAWLVTSHLQQFVWPVDPLRAAIVGGICGFFFRSLISSSSKRIPWLSSPSFSRAVFAVLVPVAFVGGAPFLISCATASCAVITPKPKDSNKSK